MEGCIQAMPNTFQVLVLNLMRPPSNGNSTVYERQSATALLQISVVVHYKINWRNKCKLRLRKALEVSVRS